MADCRCDCGARKTIQVTNLRNGATKSCGCLQREVLATVSFTHRMTGTREYAAWSAMNKRCHNPNADKREYYSDRGITVCDEWRHDFEAFFAHIGLRPSPKHSLDRIDNSGNYEPGNVRWATHTQQMRNTSRNKVISIAGVSKPLSQWLEEIGMGASTFRRRITRQGMSDAEALTIPVEYRTPRQR